MFLNLLTLNLRYSSFSTFLILELSSFVIYAFEAINVSLSTNLTAFHRFLIDCICIFFSSSSFSFNFFFVHVLFQCVLFNFQIPGLSLDCLLLNAIDFQFNSIVVREHSVGFQLLNWLSHFMARTWSLWPWHVRLKWMCILQVHVLFYKYQLGQVVNSIV